MDHCAHPPSPPQYFYNDKLTSIKYSKPFFRILSIFWSLQCGTYSYKLPCPSSQSSCTMVCWIWPFCMRTFITSCQEISWPLCLTCQRSSQVVFMTPNMLQNFMQESLPHIWLIYSEKGTKFNVLSMFTLLFCIQHLFSPWPLSSPNMPYDLLLNSPELSTISLKTSWENIVFPLGWIAVCDHLLYSQYQTTYFVWMM